MDSSQPEDPKNKLVNEARERYRAFDRFVTIQESDGMLAKAGKIAFRVLGILVMIVLSPFLFIGLLMAFAAAL